MTPDLASRICRWLLTAVLAFSAAAAQAAGGFGADGKVVTTFERLYGSSH